MASQLKNSKVLNKSQQVIDTISSDNIWHVIEKMNQDLSENYCEDRAKTFLYESGIIDKKGKLSKAYR